MKNAKGWYPDSHIDPHDTQPAMAGAMKQREETMSMARTLTLHESDDGTRHDTLELAQRHDRIERERKDVDTFVAGRGLTAPAHTRRVNLIMEYVAWRDDSATADIAAEGREIAAADHAAGGREEAAE